MIQAELRKLNLPPIILAVAGAIGLAGVLKFTSAAVIYAQAGFIILGVVAVTSEYQGGQIYTTLTAMPQRTTQYLSKMVALLIVATPAAALVGRAGEGAVYLVLTTLISASVASVLRRTIPALAGLLIFYLILRPQLHDSLPDNVGYALWTVLAVGISTALYRLRDA